MNPKYLNVRMDRMTGEFWLTFEKLRSPIKRVANLTAHVLLCLTADLTADENTYHVKRDVKLGDGFRARITVERAPPEHPVLTEGSYWQYKDTAYCVECVLPDTLIQFEDEWHPTVRYTLAPQTKLVFNRALPDFLAKFVPLPEEI